MQSPTRTGFILYVQNYAACISFYRDTLELEEMFHTEDLTCFSFGGSYLMVEAGDESGSCVELTRDRACLRMNVVDVRLAADVLITQGVKVDYQEHAWGTVAKFRDPDGNLCAYKDEFLFEKQIAQA